MEMQDLPRDEGAVNVAVGTLDLPAIGAERARADPTEEVKPPPPKEEAEEDESLGSHMVECTKLTHEWVEVSFLPLSIYEADLFLEALSCDAYLFLRHL